MKFNKWTLGLAAVGAVSLTSIAQAEESQNPVLTALSSTIISGYVDTSIHWNPGNDNGERDPGYAFARGKSDGFNLNVVKITLERPLDEGEWAAGYKVDLLFGPDAVEYNPSFPAGDRDMDMGIKQAYVALRAPVGNGIDLKLGVFDTLIGYEVFESGNNPNYTRSWGYTIEPTQHTGLLASYQINEYVGIALGVANTLSSGINDRAHDFGGIDRPKSESYKAYMGSMTLVAPDSFGPLAGGTLYAGVVNGFSRFVGGDQTSWYAGATIPTPIDGLRFGASFDYAGVSDQSDIGVDSAFAKSFALYTSFQATEKLSLHGRAEYFEITEEDEVALIADDIGIAEEILSLTATLQYDLWANVLSRLEVRWDHALDGESRDEFGFGGSGGEPFGSGQRNAWLVALNLIYKF